MALWLNFYVAGEIKAPYQLFQEVWTQLRLEEPSRPMNEVGGLISFELEKRPAGLRKDQPANTYPPDVPH
jgi:hypothetical protein